jgi:hypothetical protein
MILNDGWWGTDRLKDVAKCLLDNVHDNCITNDSERDMLV